MSCLQKNRNKNTRTVSHKVLFFSRSKRKFFRIVSRENISRIWNFKKLYTKKIIFSKKGVLRGLHIQVGSSQGKLFEVLKGKIYDVVLRRGSSTYGKYYPVLLSAQKNILFWILEVFAHGFLSLKEETVIQYSYTNYYIPENKREIP